MHWGGIAGVSGVAAVAAVAVTGPEVVRYPVVESVARERLATAALPAMLIGMSGGKVVMIREAGGITWKIGSGEGQSVGRVTLEGDGAATNVTIRFELGDNALGDSPLSGTRLTKSMAESMFKEHVDSVLSGRPFDPQRSMMTTAMEIQNNPEVMREYGQAIGDQFNQVSEMLNENGEFSTFPSTLPSEPAVNGREAVAPNPDSTRPTTPL